jgi:hypothetical protein
MRALLVLGFIAIGCGQAGKGCGSSARTNPSSSISVEEFCSWVGHSPDDLSLSARLSRIGVKPKKMTEVETRITYLEYEPLGFSVLLEAGRLRAIHLFLSGRYVLFAGALPKELSRTSTRSEVRATMGTPERTGEAPRWDRFVFGPCLVHFQYSDDDRVWLVTVMDPQTAP